MLPAAPLPVVFSQMTSPDVAHLGVAAALAGAANEVVAAATATDASAVAQPSAAVLISRAEEHLGMCMAGWNLGRSLSAHGPMARRGSTAQRVGLYASARQQPSSATRGPARRRGERSWPRQHPAESDQLAIEPGVDRGIQRQAHERDGSLRRRLSVAHVKPRARDEIGRASCRE